MQSFVALENSSAAILNWQALMYLKSGLMTDKVRLDKWLWAARFFKTRTLAATAVNGGKVHLNGLRVKPARAVSIGDQLEIQKGYDRYCIDVLDLSDRRGSEKIARILYAETAESIQQREKDAQMRKMANAGMKPATQRPSGKDRAKIRRFIRE